MYDNKKIQRLIDTAVDHAEHVEPHEIDEICLIMENLADYKSKVQEFVEHYLSKVNSDTRKSLPKYSIHHPVFQESVSKLIFEDIPEMPVLYAIGQLALGRVDTRYLHRVSVATEDDYYDFFKKNENQDHDFSELIPCLLGYRNKTGDLILGYENLFMDIYLKTCGALRRHANESELSKFLILKYLPEV